MLAEFDDLVRNRAELKRWMDLGQTVCGYQGGMHKLRVDIAEPTMVTYCGQAYSGANNYHDAPKFFAVKIRDEIKVQIKKIVLQAYIDEMARLTSLIEKYREQVMQELGGEG